MMSKLLAILFLGFSSLAIGQSCDDGVLNGSETGIDCGGFYCPPCESTVQSKLQQVITQRNLTNLSEVGNNFSLAMDASGNRYVVMYWDNVLGDNINVVFTGSTLTGQINEVHSWRNESLAKQWVDITRDGETILFSDGVGEIYVSNWDGTDFRVVADEIESQNPVFNNFELTTHSSPKFSFDGTSIYFLHRGNRDVTGLYEVGINQTIVGKWIFSFADMEDEFGAAKSSNHNTAFKELRIPDSGEVFFLSSIHNEQGNEFSIFYYHDAKLRRVIEEGPTWTYGYDISTNSDQIFYPSREGGKLMAYYRPLDRLTELDFTHFTTDQILDVSSNDAGTTALVKAFEWVSPNNGDGFFMTNLDGRVLFPIDVGNATLYAAHDRADLMVMSGQGDRLLFTNSTAFNVTSLWIADVSEPIILSDDWPRMTSLNLSQNWLELGSKIPSVDINLNAEDGTQEITNISMTYSSQKRGLYRYMNGGAAFPYGGTLSDDGEKAGDEIANDNTWTNVDCYEHMPQHPVSLPEEFRLRFNLISGDRITSYIQSMFISDMTITSTSEQSKSELLIYPSIASERINIKLPDGAGPMNFSIYNELGILLKSYKESSHELDISNFGPGNYFIVTHGKGVRWIDRFVKI